MNISEVRNRAKPHGIKSSNIFKTELIRTIQFKEGNFDCYGTARDRVCDQPMCCWREDCFAVARTEGRI